MDVNTGGLVALKLRAEERQEAGRREGIRRALGTGYA